MQMERHRQAEKDGERDGDTERDRGTERQSERACDVTPPWWKTTTYHYY